MCGGIAPIFTGARAACVSRGREYVGLPPPPFPCLSSHNQFHFRPVAHLANAWKEGPLPPPSPPQGQQGSQTRRDPSRSPPPPALSPCLPRMPAAHFLPRLFFIPFSVGFFSGWQIWYGGRGEGRKMGAGVFSGSGEGREEGRRGRRRGRRRVMRFE